MLQQHLEAKHWLFKGELNSKVHLRAHISWNAPFQLLFSTNTTSLFTGLSKYRVELSDLSEAPSDSLTLQTLPLQSLYTVTIRAICHWFWYASCLSNTMPSTWQFCFWLFHFSLFWRVSRTSFLHLSKLVTYMLHSSPLFLWISVWSGEIARWWHHYSWFHCKKVDGA